MDQEKANVLRQTDVYCHAILSAEVDACESLLSIFETMIHIPAMTKELSWDVSRPRFFVGAQHWWLGIAAE